MKTITLSYSPTARAWVAESLTDGNPDPDQLDLFGTHILSTSFTAQAKPIDVRDAIARLNPNALVMLEVSPDVRAILVARIDVTWS